MDAHTFTVIDEGKVSRVAATVRDRSVRLSADAVREALGWELTPRGLCKDDRCVPVDDRTAVVTDGGVDLSALAGLLSRPIAIEVQERVAYVGASAADRAAQLASLEAPDFTLPDLAGQMHSLSDYRGQKVLLVAYASW